MRYLAVALVAAAALTGAARGAYATDLDDEYKSLRLGYDMSAPDAATLAPAAGRHVIASHMPAHQSWQWHGCEDLYPNFDPRTGTFVAADGLTYACQ